MKKIAEDLGTGSAYPAELTQNQYDRDKDYTVMPEPEAKEYYWVLTGTHIFVSEESRKDDMPLGQHLNYDLPSAHGKVEVYSRWNAIWNIQESNMAPHLVEKRLKAYCKQQGWKYAGLVNVDSEHMKMGKTADFTTEVLPNEYWDLDDAPGQEQTQVTGPDGSYLIYEIMNGSQDIALPGGNPRTYIDGPFFKRPLNITDPVVFVHKIQIGSSASAIAGLMANLRQLNMPIYSQVINQRLHEWLKMKFQADYPGAGDNWPQDKTWRRKEWGLDNIQPDQKYFNETDPTDLDEPVGPQQCQFCGELFPTWGSLVVHENKEHNENGKDPTNRWTPVVDYDQQLPADFDTNVMDTTVERQSAVNPNKGPVPFVFDVSSDQLYVGFPGERVSDVKGKYPTKLTPGGIVEGEALPDGKLQILTDTDMPYTIRHMVLLFQHKHPEIVVKHIVHVKDKKQRKIATIDTIGQKVLNIANTDRAAREAFAALSPHGSVFIVGGAVRDIVLGKIPNDIDLMAQGIPPVDLQRLLEGLPGRVDFTGKSFGVYRYKAPDKSEVEIALPRAEVQGSGDANQDFHTDAFMSPEEDLRRRDFTGNAMAVNMATGELLMAPGTNGVEDLQNGQLKSVHEQAFHDDPNRILRAFTAISKQGLNPTPELLDQIERNAHLMSEIKKDGTRRVPYERFQMDLDKLMEGNNPEKAFRHMFETGAMNHIIPELMAAYNFEQHNPHHRKVLHEHLLEVLRSVAEQTKDKDERMAALLHDVGKPASQWYSVKGYKRDPEDKDAPRSKLWTGPDDGEPHGHFYYNNELNVGADHQTVGATMAKDILSRLKYPTKRIDKVQHLVQHHMFEPFDDEKQANKRIRLVTQDKQHPEEGYDTMRALLRIRRGDSQGKGTDEWENEIPISRQEQLVDHLQEANSATSLKDLAIGGQDLKLLGIPPGPQYTKILNYLLDQVIENPALNTKETLSQMAMDFSQGRTANILDPIRQELDPAVFDRPGDIEPSVKPKINNWVRKKVLRVMKDAGWPDPGKYVSLVLTGSLTTYQWSNMSDFDVSLWIDTNHMPDWQRSDLIALMVSQVDGTVVPGTTHPIQCFVVSPKLTKTELYKPGLRSAYDLEKAKWIVLPEKTRSVDVRKAYPSIVNYAMMMEDKMRLLLKYNPVGAKIFWHQLHYRRHRDQATGHGDYAESNIVYKWLNNSGLFPLISDTIGEYIAAAPKPSKFHTTKEQHIKRLKEQGPVKPHTKKKAAIDPAYLQKYIEQNGPYLHHDTYQDAIPFILRDGILPRAQTGMMSEWDDPSLDSRPNHAYIGQRRYLDTIQGNGRMAGLRVDLRQLDPNLIDSDEDHHQYLYFDGHTMPSGETGETWRPHPYDPAPWPNWGKWADDNTEQVDNPEFVRHSLDRGSVAVRGGVPAHAISVDPHWVPPEDYPVAQPGAPLPESLTVR